MQVLGHHNTETSDLATSASSVTASPAEGHSKLFANPHSPFLTPDHLDVNNFHQTLGSGQGCANFLLRGELANMLPHPLGAVPNDKRWPTKKGFQTWPRNAAILAPTICIRWVSKPYAYLATRKVSIRQYVRYIGRRGSPPPSSGPRQLHPWGFSWCFLWAWVVCIGGSVDRSFKKP